MNITSYLSICPLLYSGGRFPRPVAGDGTAAALSEYGLHPAASGTGVEDGGQGEGQGHILISPISKYFTKQA